jgi:hypothetical protein
MKIKDNYTLDDLLTEWSYRLEDGIIDLTNVKKLEILKTIIKEDLGDNYLHILDKIDFSKLKPVKLKEDAEQIKTKLVQVGYKDEDILIQNKSRIKLLVPGKTRQEEFNKLTKLGLGKRVNVSGTSMGGIQTKDGVIVIPKPKEKQGGGSAGLGNESFLANKINETIIEVGGPITIIFKSKNKTIKYNKVDNAEEAGRDTKGNKKSDLRIFSNGKIIGNLSLKQENASMWESADKRYKELVVKLINNLHNKKYKNVSLNKTDKEGIYRLYNPLTKSELSGIIIKDLDKSDLNSLVFGTDDPKTVVVKETFDDGDFSLSGDILTVTVNDLLKDIKDIEGTNYEPILVIRHDVTRTATSGLRPIVYTKESVYKDDKIAGNRIEISYKEI